MSKVRKPDENPIIETQPDSVAVIINALTEEIPAPATPPPTSTPSGADSIIIEVPLASNYPPSEFGVHIDSRLSIHQSTAIRRIARQLDRQQACLKNGQRVTNPNGAVKWLLEQVAASE